MFSGLVLVVGIFLWLTVVYIPDVSVSTCLKAVANTERDTMAFLSGSASCPIRAIYLWLSYAYPVVISSVLLAQTLKLTTTYTRYDQGCNANNQSKKHQKF